MGWRGSSHCCCISLFNYMYLSDEFHNFIPTLVTAFIKTKVRCPETNATGLHNRNEADKPDTGVIGGVELQKERL